VILKLAERDGGLVGAVGASTGGQRACLSHLCVKEGTARQEIAVALLGLLHADLRERGPKEVTWWCNPPNIAFTEQALAAAGYVPTGRWGVEMWALLDLPQLLREIAPLLERRVTDSDLKGWTGSIDLLGNRHRARLVFAEGKPIVAEAEGPPPGIIVACDDHTMARIVSGVETPFEAYLQTRLTLGPQVNERITGLLDTLFPNVASG
jgi:putative sterol carrier protein